MTTIAYRDGVMAGDSLSTFGGTAGGRVFKVRKVGKFLLGLSGTAGEAEEYCKLMAKNQEIMRFDDLARRATDDLGVWGLIADGNKVYRIDRSGLPYRVRGPFFACGAGMDVALGAMEMGAGAKRAVQAACKYSSGSGGPVYTVSHK